MRSHGGWTQVEEFSRFGVALHNFSENGFSRLSLDVGDTLHLLQETEEWYYGFKTKNRGLVGIFPKSYVHVKECEVDQSGIYPSASPKEPPIAQEITSTLREWLVLWKGLYVAKGDHFNLVKLYMQRLIEWRKLLMCGKLTQEETRDHHQKVVNAIDTGNSVLGLDMVVRDEDGNVLNPERSGAVKLFRAHERSAEIIHAQRETISGKFTQKAPSIPKHTYSLMLTVGQPFNCNVGEEVDLQFGLYDSHACRFFTDFYTIRLAKNGKAKEIQNHSTNFKAVYTDLGKEDLLHKYLVCQIVRYGKMDLKDQDKKGLTLDLRRPFGVAVKEISSILMHKQNEGDEDKFEDIPVHPCGDRENFDAVVKKVVSQKDLSSRAPRDSVKISLRRLEGDYKQLMDDYPHLVVGNTAVARKMGFPEVIYPKDFRNDIYVTIVEGEFSPNFKNVEVTMTVHNRDGKKLPDVICDGRGGFSADFRTVTYWHEVRPKWNETIKIQIPQEVFRDSHLRFVFKHRSSTETRDRAEKPFALAYMRLMKDKDQTTIHDGDHDLILYALNQRKADAIEGYLDVPSLKSQLDSSLYNNRVKMTADLTVTNKDNLKISTLLCSTKLTQNVDILNVFNWRENSKGLQDVLKALMEVQGEEIVKFLQDIFDILFLILIENQDCDLYDNLVFECLVYIITLMSDRKYSHFKSVLDVYIHENFCATLAYNKLIVVLKYYIDHCLTDPDEEHNRAVLQKALKSIKYIFKFIIRSWKMFSELREGQGRKSFIDSLESLFESLAKLMSFVSETSLPVQGSALKYLPCIVDDVIQEFEPLDLTRLLVSFPDNLSPKRLTRQKTQFLDDLIKTNLFHIEACREELISAICKHLAEPLGSQTETELESVSDVLMDMMDALHRNDIGSNTKDLMTIFLKLMRPVIQNGVIAQQRVSSLRPKFVSVMIAMLASMSEWHYQNYLCGFATSIDVQDFLTEILMVFCDLVSKDNSVFQKDWSQMLLFQNAVILKSLRLFSGTITQLFIHPNDFKIQLLRNFFYCSVKFLTHESMQLETFSQNKRKKIISRYKDMRREMAYEIKLMWRSLGGNKRHFVPDLVGLFLEMNLIPQPDIRRLTIPIFYEMMECEFKQIIPGSTGRGGIKGSFDEFESEMIEQLDVLVEGGQGDEAYNDLFKKIMTELCNLCDVPQLKAQGKDFVKTVCNLFQRLLQYRAMINDESTDNRMKCTVNLLEFYNELERQEMYIRYLYKLSDLHMDCDNFTEAAYTLMHHARLLSWSKEELHKKLETEKYPDCHTHLDLKVRLYIDIIDLFDKGKLWEKGIELCKELAQLYENELYDYNQLSFIHRKLANFFDNISLTDFRPEPEYYRVGFYGKGYPSFLCNKEYVYRGEELERLADFTARIQNQYPQAKLMDKLLPPKKIPGEYLESKEQYLQINRVAPVMDPGMKRKFKGKNVAVQISRYYKVNEVREFTFDKRLKKASPGVDESSDIGTLWVERTTLETTYSFPGILRWFPVSFHKTFEISPLQFAVETMEDKSKDLRSKIERACHPNFNIDMLSMNLNGIIDAAVMGGTKEYEKAFFTPAYLQANSHHKHLVEQLKDQIAMQIPILAEGIEIHRQLAPVSLRPFHQKLEECFKIHREHVIQNYGKAEAYEVAYRRRPLPRAQPAPVSYVKQTEESAEQQRSSETDSEESISLKSSSKLASMGSKIASVSKGLSSSSARALTSPNKMFSITGNAAKHLSNNGLIASGGGGSNQQPDLITNGVVSPSSQQQQHQIELSQELTPQRPPRPSVDARNASRPPSDGSNNSQPQINSLHPSSSFAASSGIGSPDSDGPPPLPSKGEHASVCSATSGLGLSRDSSGGSGDLLRGIQSSLSTMALGSGEILSPDSAGGPPAIPKKEMVDAPPPSLPQKGRVSIQGLSQLQNH